MKVRQEYYTEQVGKESYREVLANDDTLRDAQLKVLWQIVYGPKTLQEVSELTGMKEHLVFPEISTDAIEHSFGLEISIVTNAGRDDVARSLLKSFNFPFATE